LLRNPWLNELSRLASTEVKPMKTAILASVAAGLVLATPALARGTSDLPYQTRALTPAHENLARSAGIPALIANQDYVEALARIVYYWGYPAVDGFGRTNMWEIMKDGPGAIFHRDAVPPLRRASRNGGPKCSITGGRLR
jgi:hypothetical protein